MFFTTSPRFIGSWPVATASALLALALEFGLCTPVWMDLHQLSCVAKDRPPRTRRGQRPHEAATPSARNSPLTSTRPCDASPLARLWLRGEDLPAPCTLSQSSPTCARTTYDVSTRAHRRVGAMESRGTRHSSISTRRQPCTRRQRRLFVADSTRLLTN